MQQLTITHQYLLFIKERRVNFMNKAGVAISGKLPEDVIGYNDEEICPPEVDKEYIDRLRKTYLTKEPQHFEHSFILKGKKMSHVVDYIPLLDDNGQIRQVLGIAVDVTERKEFEEMLKRRTSELASSNNELEAFSYSVSHDLRSPLHTLKGFTELLFEDYESKLDETARDYLRRIVNSANKMNALINDMLRLSRISRQDISMQEINLSMLAREIIDELSEQHPERHVEVIIHDKLKIKGDKQLLKIALMNLLGNAWKYTSKTTEPRIEFGSCQQNNKTVFFIHDNGAGFPMEQADKLFTPFQRLHPEGEFSGTGIGLPIVERVIRRHDGKIWAEAELNKGATFFFTLDENIENTNDNNRRSGSVKNL